MNIINKLLDQIKVYASYGLAFYAIATFIYHPKLRFTILNYLVMAMVIGLILDYLVPAIVYANKLLRYICPLAIVNVIVIIWNLVYTARFDFLTRLSYWSSMALFSLICVFIMYVTDKRYKAEKERIQMLLERKIRETS